MTISLSFTCDNSAFGSDREACASEVTRIMAGLADRLGDQLYSGITASRAILDTNGNVIGTVHVTA